MRSLSGSVKEREGLQHTCSNESNGLIPFSAGSLSVLRGKIYISQVTGRLLKGCGVHVETAPPFESSHLDQTGNDLDLPVIAL